MFGSLKNQTTVSSCHCDAFGARRARMNHTLIEYTALRYDTIIDSHMFRMHFSSDGATQWFCCA